MNKLEKMKLDEIQHELYTVNQYIGMKFIATKDNATPEEIIKVSDSIAKCIRQIRNMVM
jgi:hypothetical protein